MGELMVNIPVGQEGLIRNAAPNTERHTKLTYAVAQRLRHFTNVARIDLSRWPWRRKVRVRRWQLYRPKPVLVQPIEIDVAELMPASKAPGN